MTVSALVLVVWRGQDIHERRGAVYGVDLMEVVPVGGEHARAALLRVLRRGAQHRPPQRAHLRRGQRGLRLRAAGRPLQPVEAADPDFAVQHFEHPVHPRVVVEGDGGAALQQEHPHAELVRLADVHVGDRGRAGVVEGGTRGAVIGPPRDELQVWSSHFRHQAPQFAVVLQEGFAGLLPEPRRAPEGHQSLPGYSLDDGAHGAVRGHHTEASPDLLAVCLFATPLACIKDRL